MSPSSTSTPEQASVLPTESPKVSSDRENHRPSGGVDISGSVGPVAGDIVGRDKIVIGLIAKSLEKPLAFAIISVATSLTAIALAQVKAAALLSGLLNGVIGYFSSATLIASDPERFWFQIFELDDTVAKSAAASGAAFYLISYFTTAVVFMRMQKWAREEIFKYFVGGLFTGTVLICASGICSRLAGFSFPVANVVACNFYSAGAFVDGAFVTYCVALGVLALISPNVLRSFARSNFRKFPDSENSLGYWLSFLILVVGIIYTTNVTGVALLKQSNSYILVYGVLVFAVWGLRRSLATRS